MPDANDWNERMIAEFRANGGRIGGNFEGAPIVLVHQPSASSRATSATASTTSRRAGTRASPTTRSALLASVLSRSWN